MQVVAYGIFHECGIAHCADGLPGSDRIPGFDRNRAIMVGDSMNADIQGAKNAGIATCWLNPNRKPATIFPDYQIESLTQLEALLEKA